MSTIVDIRLGRIGIACTRLIGADADSEMAPMRGRATNNEAEIILFPKLHLSRQKRPRKKLMRRFTNRTPNKGIGKK